ncbi:MAG: RNA polymerase sigma factor [Chitinivibrionales bacterium]
MNNMESGTGSFSIGNDEDWELVRRCQEGSKDPYFKEIVNRYYTLVFNIGFRFFSDKQMAEDTAQEVFLKVLQKIEEISIGKQPFVHWLCRVTTNTCKSHFRKRRTEEKNMDNTRECWYGDYGSDDEDMDDETKIAVDNVNTGLQSLGKEERMVLILSHIVELKTTDIAPIVKKPRYTVRRELRRGEEKLRKFIKQRMIEKNAV